MGNEKIKKPGQTVESGMKLRTDRGQKQPLVIFFHEHEQNKFLQQEKL